MSSKKRIIMGIDPGSLISGWGIVEDHRRAGEFCQYSIIASGVARVTRNHPKGRRLYVIADEIGKVMNRFQGQIDEVCIEDIFMKKSVKTSIVLGQVQGALMAKSYEILDVNPILISPARVRARIGAGGAAGKEQTAAWVRGLTGCSKEMSFDESDAIAIALAGHFERGSPPQGGRRPEYEN